MLKLPPLPPLRLPLRLPDPRRAAARLADARLPAPAVKLASLLPQLPPSLALATALNLALGQGVSAIPAALQGRQVRFVITDAGLDLCLELGAEGFRPAALPKSPCDATITATRRDFLALALREEDSDTLFFTRRLLMEGNTEVGLLVRNLLDAVDVDGLGLRTFAPWRVLAQAHRLMRARSPGRLVLW